MAMDANTHSDEDLELLMRRARAQIKWLNESRADFLRSADDALEKMARVSGRPNRLRAVTHVDERDAPLP